MHKIIKSGDSEITIERSDLGMGIYLSGSSREGNLEFEEAADLLSDLIDYLLSGDEKEMTRFKRGYSGGTKVIPLPKEIKYDWTSTPWVWRGGVIVCEESLEFYKHLTTELRLVASGRDTTEFLQVVYLQRAIEAESISNEILRNLGKLS